MSGSYPFIDIAALKEVREGFAKGDAQLVISRDLMTVIWANGAGGALFGHSHINDFIGRPFDLPVSARRQIAVFSQAHDNGPRTMAVRLGGGVRSELTHLTIAELNLPDGASALLLSVPRENSQFKDIIEGLGDDTTHVALLDKQANVLAASPLFDKLNIATSTLEDLMIEAGDAENGLVKRRIRIGTHAVPGALARLSDELTLCLLSVVGDASHSPTRSDVSVDDLKKEPVSPEVELSPERQSKAREFAFDPQGEPARFIWKADASGSFTEISPELGVIIGPNAADVVGRRFSEVANVFGFDTDGSIAALLQKRDTWSGKRILWPVEGTNLRVPVELAALPVYSRDREFVGFRGFGLVNPKDAEQDPETIGIVLAGGVPQKRVLQEEQAALPLNSDGDDVLALSEEVANDDHPSAKKYQPPVILTPNPGRRESDKVLELLNAAAREKVATDHEKDFKAKAERRPEGGLTATERNAFREIADRLRKQGLASSQHDHKTAGEKLVSVEQVKPAAEQVSPVELVSHRIKENVAHKPVTDAATSSGFGETGLLANLPVPVIIHSRGEIHYVNQALLDLTGYEALDDLRKAGGVDALFNSEADDNEKRQGMVLRLANGNEQPVDAHLNAINWRAGRALMLSLLPVAEPAFEFVAPSPSFAEQVFDDRSQKQDLEAHIEELKTILDTATDGVVLIDPEGRIRSMNHSASALFGYDLNDTEGKFFSMLFAIESQRAAMDYLHGLSDNGVLSVLNDGREVIGREAQGGFIPLFMTMGKLPHTNGYCAVLRDITQWKRTEEELTNARREAERASNQKTEFLARISHEIRTPLNAIIGFSELMSDERFGPIGNERYRDYLRDINRSGNHVLALVNDLLDISKIEAGALEMNFEAVSLNDAIGEAIALMQPQANRERVIIRSSFQSNLPDIVADARSIKQVALNLLSNAVRFTATAGQVIVSTNYELNGDVVMRVRDTGVGMTKAELEQALKPFRQVNTLQRRQAEGGKDWRSEGTGLGLPLTKAMVEANRAQFTIDSTPGQGTVVEIAFPPTRVLAD